MVLGNPSLISRIVARLDLLSNPDNYSRSKAKYKVSGNRVTFYWYRYSKNALFNKLSYKKEHLELSIYDLIQASEEDVDEFNIIPYKEQNEYYLSTIKKKDYLTITKGTGIRKMFVYYAPLNSEGKFDFQRSKGFDISRRKLSRLIKKHSR